MPSARSSLLLQHMASMAREGCQPVRQTSSLPGPSTDGSAGHVSRGEQKAQTASQQSPGTTSACEGLIEGGSCDRVPRDNGVEADREVFRGAHLLLQLRRGSMEPQPLRADRSAVSFGVQGAGGPLRGSGGTEASPGDADAGVFAILNERMNQNPGSGGRPRPRTMRGEGRGGGAAVASSFSTIGGNRKGQCGSTSLKKAATRKTAATLTATVADVAGQAVANAARARIVGKKRGLAVQVIGSGTAGAGPATERVFTGRDVNLTNASLPGPVKLGRSGNEGCTCKKSKCLKLYCQCFARQSVCTQACRCEDCHNSVQHDAERQVAVTELLRRSPNAFGTKFTTEVNAAAGGTTTSSAVVHSNGCGCSKSACLKRYCECFNVGIACSDKCRCRNCKNKAASVPARTGPGIGAGAGDLGVRNVDTMSSTTLHPPTTAVNIGDTSRAGTGDAPEISAKRPRTTVMKRHP